MPPTPAPPPLTWAEVCTRRLARHALDEPATNASPATLVGAICGAHAQILSAAEVSIALRLDGATRATIRTALWDERSLVKTFGPRGTVHLLPTHELPLWTGALSALPHAPNSFPEGVRLTAEQTDTIVAAIADALADAELTVTELDGAVVARAGAWAGERVMPAFQTFWPRWRQVVNTAAHRGALCFGPNRGRNVTYTSPRRWLPGFRPDAPDTASAALLKRYLHAYGPATPQIYARWLSTSPAWANALFARVRDELAEVAVEDGTAWVVAGDTAAPPDPPRGLRLLPYFDPYIVGAYPRERVFPGRAFARATARGQGGNYPVLLIDGTVAGVWHQRRAGETIAITVEPLADLTAAQRRDLDAEAARLGAILAGTPSLTIGPVTVGPHA